MASFQKKSLSALRLGDFLAKKVYRWLDNVFLILRPRRVMSSTAPVQPTPPQAISPRNPLPLLIGGSAAAFFSLLGFVMAISPTNREHMFRPNPEAMAAEGHDAAAIQQFVEFSQKVDETQYLAVSSIYILCAIALIFGAMRYKWAFGAYMILVGIMQIAWAFMGLFNPMQLVLPIVVMVMASMNREILR